MIEAPHYSAAGARRDSPFALPADFFDGTVHEPVMHQAVRAFLNNQRQGTHQTKTRSFVSGGNQKPWKQKGTGRARQGSTRAPHWRGGGVAHGPHPRSYRQRTPKKMVWLALRSALSDRAGSGMVIVVDDWAFSVPKTKDALAALKAVGVPDGDRVLVVLSRDDEVAWKSFRNLGGRVDLCSVEELNTYDVLVADRIVFTSATLAALSARLGGQA